MQYFHFTETNGRTKREVAFSFRTENELAWMLGEFDVKAENAVSVKSLAAADKGETVFRDGNRVVTFKIVDRTGYELVKARKLQNSFAGL